MSTVIDLKKIDVCFTNYSVGNLTLKNKVYRMMRRQQLSAFKALDSLDLKIRENETLGLIGVNGAGKSTLLRVISQIIVPTNGSVSIKRRVVPLLEIGIGFQPDLSGRENCYLAGALLGFTPEIMHKSIDGIIDFSGIKQFIDKPIKTYSSGMYARLAFALATAVDPEILLLDEIFGVGDEFFQRKCVVRIQNLIQKGVTAILVSHNLDFLVAQCSRLVWLEHGKVKMDGQPEKVADRYRKGNM